MYEVGVFEPLLNARAQEYRAKKSKMPQWLKMGLQWCKQQQRRHAESKR
jgi:ribosomal protein S16